MNAESDGWAPCPQGLIAESMHRVRRRRRAEIGLAAGMAALVMVVGIGWQLWPQAAPAMSGLTCRETAQRMPAYLRGELGGPEVTRVDQHLHDCPGCRERLQRLRTGRSGQLISGHRSVALAAVFWYRTDEWCRTDEALAGRLRPSDFFSR